MKRCKDCNKILFFKYKYSNENFYCIKCFEIIKERESEKLRLQENLKLKALEKNRIERSRIRNELADKRLKEELEKEKVDKKEKANKKIQKNQIKTIKKAKNITIKTPKFKKIMTFFDDDTIKKYSKLLYIEADIKEILAIEWFNGKKRIILNKKRELRRTHAGGYSAEKFQKFIDAKKRKTAEWIIDLLDRPGVLRPGYDKINVISQREDLKDEIERYLKKYKK